MKHTWHFVGIGGIGMSGLAQMARALDYEVSGSDRALEAPENAELFSILRRCGVKLYPQDGSRFQDSPPEMLVASTAIEDDNPDFAAAPAGQQKLHRSKAMELLIKSCDCECTIAVAGTCGKTSVTAHLAEALYHLDCDPGMLCGGYVSTFRTELNAGNYRRGSGKYFVFEADESDKSLLNYASDVSLILNIGTDHYSKEELARVFGEFLSSTRRLGVVQLEAWKELSPHLHGGPPNIVLFSSDPDAPAEADGHKVYHMTRYCCENGMPFVNLEGVPQRIPLPAPGVHNGANTLAIYAALTELGLKITDPEKALGSFNGVHRRFNRLGKNRNGALVVDDYAHNMEKILSCLRAGKELCTGKRIAVFQPHGFKPLGFMREELFRMLEEELDDADEFLFLDVYYAGGTSSFTPTSGEVAESYAAQGRKHYFRMKSREDAERHIREVSRPGDVILIMGARDNSLALWGRTLVTEKECLS